MQALGGAAGGFAAGSAALVETLTQKSRPQLFSNALPGTVAWGLTIIATQIGNGINKPQYASIAQITGVVITITGLFIMVPRYGVAGAAIVRSHAATF